MTDLPSRLQHAGFRPRAGAAPDAVARTESALGVRLPDEFTALWTFSDGLAGDGIDITPLSAADGYAGCFEGGFGYVPFTDCNDSNPYAVCCHEPLRGVIAHVFHDEEARLVCRGLGRFLDLVAEARRTGGEVDRLPGDFAFDRPDRSSEDAATARELMQAAEGMDRYDRWRSEGLRFAAQLLGPGQEDELAAVLDMGDEYVREAVRRRWAGLGTPAARDWLRRDTASYRAFLAELKGAFESAGLRTEPSGQNKFVLQPGNVGLNFAMLFADSRRPGAVAEWVQRFKDRMEQA